MKDIILQAEGYNNQKKWLLITAEYRGDLYIVNELGCLGSGAIYPTSFKDANFSPDSEHVENVKISIYDSEDEFNTALNNCN